MSSVKKMSISCESVARHILPIYRSFIAKELINKYNMTQNQAAKKLGTTQAAISQYVNSKRGVKCIPNYEENGQTVQTAAEKIAKQMATSEVTREEFNTMFCHLCMEIRKTDKCP
ncbi:MAG: helix-turn-helix domain-containing protein [Candidatus Bathyarchaeota archaeon]|nr:helix-turn-helix domain-containing protein [Candidatus Bathyarchaeota archaeon]